MKDLVALLIQLVTVLAPPAGPGVRGLVAENLLLKQRLLVLGRTRRWAPNLTSVERFVLGLYTLFVAPGRIELAGISGGSNRVAGVEEHSGDRRLQNSS